MIKINKLRWISQLFSVGLITYVGLQHQIVGGGPQGSAPIDSYCPLGGIETAYLYLTTGQFVEKTNFSNFILLGAVLVLTLLVGAAFCSWVCPFGAVQEWLAMVGRKLFGRNLTIPMVMHKYLRHLRFGVLFLIVWFTTKETSLVFEEYDPFKVIFHLNFETTTAIVIFVATIILSIAVDRFWCKYLCPLGAVISVFSRFSIVNLKRDRGLCISCGKCTKECPMCTVVGDVTQIPAEDCTKCFSCLKVCPKPDAMSINVGGGSK